MPMTQSLGGFRAALLVGWIALGAAGMWFARDKGIPNWAALPVLAAFLVEYPFYLVAGFPALREKLERTRLPLFLTASALAPYLVACWGTGQFQAGAVMRLAALALALSLWYVVLPAAPAVDIAFLGLVAAVLLGRYFDGIYRPPYPGADTAILGHLALIQITILVLLVERRVPDAGFGFLPGRRDWITGFLHYLCFLAIGFPLGLGLHVMRFGPPAPAWKIAATFLGILWVVALSEEFFFRGVLQAWMEQWTGSRQVALAATSLAFGAVHLPFRGFPNWRFALLAAIAGWFYGRARNQTGSVRASMVAHALVVTTWRAVFV